MWKISFGLDLRCSSDSSSLKFDKMADTMENWRCIVFGLNRLNGEGKELRFSPISEFLEKGNLTTDPAKI